MYESSAVVIAHYHPQGRVADYMVNLVKHLARKSNTIVFVSTGINDAAIETIEAYARVIRRDNIGYDFWSYKLGIDELGDLAGLERLLLLNSSFIATDPESLTPYFFEPVKGPLIKGLTFSHEVNPHIQSYLFSFETSDLIRSSAFKEWWENMQPINDKDEVVRRYECGMSDYFRRKGYKFDTAFKPSKQDLFLATGRLISSRNLTLHNDCSSIIKLDLEKTGVVINPTHYLWDLLYMRFGVLKIKLLKENPTGQNLATIYSLEPKVLQLINDALH